MVIVTLAHGIDPHKTLDKMLNLTEGGVDLGGDLVSYDEDGNASVDVDQLLEGTPVEN